MQIALDSPKKNSLKRQLKVSFAIDDFNQQFNTRLKNIAKNAKMSGFRPGKIPMNILQKQHGEETRHRIINQEMQRAFQKAIIDEKLHPAGPGEFTEMNIDNLEKISFTAELEVLPEVKLCNFSKLSVKRKIAKLDDDDIQKQLETYQKQHTLWQEKSTADAEATDQVTIDFHGTIDGKDFNGNSATDFPVVLGEKRMLSDFEDALYGVRAGAEKTINVKFSKDYNEASLAGKKAQFVLTIKAVKSAKTPELDDTEFLKKVGIASKEILIQKITKTLLKQLQQLLDYANKQLFFEILQDKHKILIPEVLVSQELKLLGASYRESHNLGDNEEISVEKLNELREQAISRIRLGLLIGQISKELNITQNPETLEEQYLETALRMFGDARQVALLKQHENITREVESLALERELVNKLYSIVKVKEVPTTFKELENEAKKKA